MAPSARGRGRRPGRRGLVATTARRSARAARRRRRRAPARHLVWRAWELGWTETWAILRVAARTWELLTDTIGLAVGHGATLAISLPLAWLTTRTDLPAAVLGGRHRTAARHPHLRRQLRDDRRARGPRGILQGWLEPLGVERLPSIYGFWGAFVVLTLFTYPYVLLTVRAAYRRLDPSLEEASRTLGRNSFVTFVRVVLPQLRPVDRRRIAAGRAVRAVGLRGRVDAALRHLHPSDLRAVPRRPQPRFRRRARPDAGACSPSPCSPPSSGSAARAVHRLHGAGARVAATVRLGRWRWARRACAPWCSSRSSSRSRDRLLALAWDPRRRVVVPAPGRWCEQPDRLGARRAVDGRVLAPGRWRCWRFATRAIVSVRRAALVVGLRAARHRRRAGAGVLRCQVRARGRTRRWRCWCSPTWCCSCPRRSAPSGRRCCRSRRRSRRRRTCSARGRSRPSGGWSCR
jgi:hypothetical protein